MSAIRGLTILTILQFFGCCCLELVLQSHKLVSWRYFKSRVLILSALLSLLTFPLSWTDLTSNCNCFLVISIMVRWEVLFFKAPVAQNGMAIARSEEIEIFLLIQSVVFLWCQSTFKGFLAFFSCLREGFPRRSWYCTCSQPFVPNNYLITCGMKSTRF